MSKRIRVLIAKPGLDGHERGALVISQALSHHGMEVIYSKLWQLPVQIATAAIQEDVDVIGLTSLSGAHKILFPKVIDELEKRGAGDIPVIGCGVIPSDDIPYLLEKGVKKIFTSDSSTEMLASYIQELIYLEQEPLTPPKRIAHIGIAVQSIDNAISFYTDFLNLELEAIEEVPTEDVKVAFIKIGETRIELLEPTHENSSIKKFIDKKGEGLHHIALEVDDIKARLKKLKDNGLKLLNEEPKKGAHQSQIAFIHPKSTGRVLFELCEYPSQEEE